MKKIKAALIYSLLFALMIIIGVYFAAIFMLSEIINSEKFKKALYDFSVKNYGVEIVLNEAEFKITPGLKFEFNAKEAGVKKTDKIIFLTKNLKVNGRFKTLKIIKADYLYFSSEVKFINSTSKKKREFDFSKLPEIYLKNADLKVKDFDFKISNLKLHNMGANKRNKILLFEGEASSKYLYKKIFLNGEFLINKKSLISEGSKVILDNSELNIKGTVLDKHYGTNLGFKGEKLPINELMAALLYYQKSNDGSKKFIENFRDYGGTLDVNVNYRNGKLCGKLVANNLSAQTVLFNAPIFFKKAEFLFDGDNLTSSAVGTLAEEGAAHILKIENVLNKNREVFGGVYLNLTSKGAKYINGLKVFDVVKLQVDYHTKNKKTDVNYSVDIKKGADIIYKDAYLGLRNKNRRVFVKTFKDRNLYIKNYNYSIINGDSNYNIISGDGLFIKKTGPDKKEHLYPKFLSAKTNGYAPASFTGSFGKYVEGGEFKGDLKYDFEENLITGDFIIRDFAHKDFYVKEAKVNADKDFINILANGEYKGSDFTCNLKAKNHLADKIKIYTLNLFLEKYVFKTRPPKNFKRQHKHRDIYTGVHKNMHRNIYKIRKFQQGKFYNKVKDFDVEIENWSIKAGELVKDKISLKDILLKGSLINDAFNFSTSNINFAGGTMSAKGIYDFKKDTSSIDFQVQKIDSNMAADLLFNLGGLIEGTADGHLKIKTFNKFNDIKAYTEFKINDGNITKLGDIEFTTKRDKKIKVSDIINIDTKDNSGFSSDIEGNFYFDNYKIYDINLTSQQKYLAFLIKGNLDIRRDYADLMLFGKYNTTAGKGVKILFIPISFIIKFIFRPENTFKSYKPLLSKIPDIEAKKDEINYFRMFFKGNFRDKVDVELKSIVE